VEGRRPRTARLASRLASSTVRRAAKIAKVARFPTRATRATRYKGSVIEL